MDPKNTASAALVEMENPKQARQIILEMSSYPFMMSGMPRPVRARAAEVEMFDVRPSRPGRKIHFRWVEPGDPDFQVANQIKQLTKKHAAEASFLLKHQLAEEEKLAQQQAETLKANYKKYELMDGVLGDGTVKRLARRYNMNITDS